MQHILDAIDICVGSVHATLTEILVMRKLIVLSWPHLILYILGIFSCFVYVLKTRMVDLLFHFVLFQYKLQSRFKLIVCFK